MNSFTPLPYLHPPGPVLRGRLKTVPADFVVEELPAYLPRGEGEHLLLWLEKEDVSAEALLKHVARVLGIRQGDIGSAGMKDRRAITRQWLSIPARCSGRASGLQTDQIRILKARRHGNKLRTGHLKGNWFSVLVRDPHSLTRDPERSAGRHHDERSPLTVAAERCHEILRRGFPNYYGEQRFGHDGETLQLGFDLLTRRKSPRDIPHARRRFLLKLALSAVQSQLFNSALARRIVEGLVETVLAGDVMEVVASGGKFVAEDPVVEQPRCDAYETVITGPMFGPKMRSPAGVPAERELRLLEAEGLQPLGFGTFGDLLSGARRPYLVRPSELSVAAEAEGLRFQFTLPPGAYATTLLRELVMTEETQG